MPVIPKKRKLLQISNYCKLNIYTIFHLTENEGIVPAYVPFTPREGCAEKPLTNQKGRSSGSSAGTEGAAGWGCGAAAGRGVCCW